MASHALAGPEKRLLFAVLRRAFYDYLGSGLSERTAAADWIFGDDDPDLRFSFRWVCDNLGLERNGVRSWIKEHKRKKGFRTLHKSF